MGGKILSAAILIACVSFSTANAQFEPGKDATYFCNAEFAGGLAYDEPTKKWKGTALDANAKFVPRLKHLRSRVETDILGGKDTVYDYNITIAFPGDRNNDRFPCDEHSEDYVKVSRFGGLDCKIGVVDYRINLRTSRFLLTYPGEYMDNDFGSSPSVTGGTCTKID
jgi:hypothetical protein